jgi:hypothetical protein
VQINVSRRPSDRFSNLTMRLVRSGGNYVVKVRM